MHAFHFYAVKDRVDMSSFSDIKPDPAIVDVTKLLISKADVHQLTKEVTVLLSRYNRLHKLNIPVYYAVELHI